MKNKMIKPVLFGFAAAAMAALGVAGCADEQQIGESDFAVTNASCDNHPAWSNGAAMPGAGWSPCNTMSTDDTWSDTDDTDFADRVLGSIAEHPVVRVIGGGEGVVAGGGTPQTIDASEVPSLLGRSGIGPKTKLVCGTVAGKHEWESITYGETYDRGYNVFGGTLYNVVLPERMSKITCSITDDNGTKRCTASETHTEPGTTSDYGYGWTAAANKQYTYHIQADPANATASIARLVNEAKGEYKFWAESKAEVMVANGATLSVTLNWTGGGSLSNGGTFQKTCAFQPE